MERGKDDSTHPSSSSETHTNLLLLLAPRWIFPRVIPNGGGAAPCLLPPHPRAYPERSRARAGMSPGGVQYIQVEN